MAQATGDRHAVEALQAAWARSDQLFELLTPDALLVRPIPLRQPVLFYLGHLPAFACNQVWCGALGRPRFNATFDALFERGIDPPDDGSFVADDAASWPSPDDIVAYRDRVRATLLESLGAPELSDVVHMVVEHELMHHETLMYMMLQLPAAMKGRPAGLPPRACLPPPAPKRATVPGGRVVLGAPRDGRFGWDNEFPEWAVDVASFGIDTLPVTNRDFLAFVEAGGYGERALWSADGWRWRTRQAVSRPSFWRGGEGSLAVAALFEDVPFGAAAEWPVYVTHAEATAYACWKGARLPTEAEFHRAAFGGPGAARREHPWGDEPPTANHGNLGFTGWEPTPVGTHMAGRSAFGVHELVGNGWEWTATPFRPFPGFATDRRYPGYSADFFDERHFVLLGGSWATDLRLVRRSFRNWFQPHYPYVFAKFRCVWSADEARA